MTRQVNANSATKGIPVIALTAHAMVQDKEKVFPLGAEPAEWPVCGGSVHKEQGTTFTRVDSPALN